MASILDRLKARIQQPVSSQGDGVIGLFKTRGVVGVAQDIIAMKKPILTVLGVGSGTQSARSKYTPPETVAPGRGRERVEIF